MRSLLILSLFFTQILFAESVTLSLEQVGSYSKRHHPALVAARLQIDEAQARYRGSGRMPNPSMEIAGSRSARANSGKWEVVLSQPFPITARLGLAKTLSAQQIDLAKVEVKEAERAYALRAQESALRIIALRAQAALTREQKGLLSQLTDFALEAARRGELPVLDAERFRLEQIRLELNLDALQREEALYLGQLQEQLGLPSGKTLSLKGSGLPVIRIPAGRKDSEQRPEIQRALLRQRTAATEVAIARSERWADPEIGVTWEKDDEHFVGLRLSLPLPLWNNNRAEVEEKQIAQRRASLEAESVRHSVSHEITNLRREMQAQARACKETEGRLLPAALEQTRLVESAYRQGQADLTTLLESQRQQLSLRSIALEQLRDFHLARLRFEHASKP